MLQKDTQDKLEGQGKKLGDFKTVANKVSLRRRYDEEENEICRTYVERFKWFISSTDIRGLCGGKKKSWCTEKGVDEGYYGLDRSGKIYNGEASRGGESELEAHSCQPLLSLRRRQLNE